MNYEITLKDEAVYIIKANSEEQAIEIACEWFEERKPEISVKLTDEEADNE